MRVGVCVHIHTYIHTHTHTRTHTQGLDLAVQNMRVGDKWDLVIPSALAFGDKGVKATAGKPKIPGGAIINYTVLLETFPGVYLMCLYVCVSIS